MIIAGTKFCGHDSALCKIDTKNKKIFAISTERVTRIKHDTMDIEPILENYNLGNFDYVAHSYSDFGDLGRDGELRAKMVYTKKIEKAIRSIIKPTYIKDLNISRSDKNLKILKSIFTNFSNVRRYYAAKISRAFILNSSSVENEKAFRKYIANVFKKYGNKPKNIFFHDHHLCHAIPSYYLSPFVGKRAIALTLDGQGDGYFSKAYLFDSEVNFSQIGSSKADFLGQGDWFSSLGRIYNYFTRAMDLRANSDEGKVEALAAFGKPDKLLLKQLGETSTINYDDMSIIYDKEKILKFYDLNFLKEQRRILGDENFCAVVQTYLEETVCTYLDGLYLKYKTQNLCLSGGVAANIIMSLNIFEKTKFKNIFVLPPMGDEGLALGSAMKTAIDLKQDISWLNEFYMPYFGDEYSQNEVESNLKKFKNIKYQFVGDKWPEEAAKSVSKGEICALFHSRMEFGPRALGNRSIIANPMFNDIRDRINSTVKKRPSYQPFCPSILEEERERLFIESFAHKHMAIAFRMKKKYIRDLPCAVHIDGTARPQFVEKADNPNYYKYLKELKKLTGYGVSLNTSFNLHGRTIVRTPEDAVIDFIDCNIDKLFIEGFVVERR